MVIEEGSYVDMAEKIMTAYQNEKRRKNQKGITTSKIRNLLAMSADIYNEVLEQGEKLPEEINARIDYLRMRVAYESGREWLVKEFVEKTKIMEALKEIQGSRKQFILFNHYMEALVAYHRYYGGRDQ